MNSNRLLLIESERVNGKLTVGLLCRQGYDVIWVRNFSEGMAAAIEEQPDFILVDIMSEEETTLKGMKQLGKLPATRDIPIIVITSDMTSGQNRLAMAAGAVGCIRKRCPFPWMPWEYTAPRALLETLRGIIDASRRSRAASAAAIASRGEARSNKIFSRALLSLEEGYAVGTMLQLTNGSICKVREGSRNGDRPLVDLVIDKTGNHPEEALTIDLADEDNASIRVTRLCA